MFFAVNIHTHFLPVATLGPWFVYEAYTSPSSLHALPTTLFSLFALLCLLKSCTWHLFAGTSTFRIMETAARVDYLGIGSHAIWHVSIVAAILLHRSMIPTLASGLGGECCDVCDYRVSRFEV